MTPPKESLSNFVALFISIAHFKKVLVNSEEAGITLNKATIHRGPDQHLFGRSPISSSTARTTLFLNPMRRAFCRADTKFLLTPLPWE